MPNNCHDCKFIRSLTWSSVPPLQHHSTTFNELSATVPACFCALPVLMCYKFCACEAHVGSGFLVGTRGKWFSFLGISLKNALWTILSNNLFVIDSHYMTAYSHLQGSTCTVYRCTYIRVIWFSLSGSEWNALLWGLVLISALHPENSSNWLYLYAFLLYSLSDLEKCQFNQHLLFWGRGAGASSDKTTSIPHKSYLKSNMTE